MLSRGRQQWKGLTQQQGFTDQWAVGIISTNYAIFHGFVYSLYAGFGHFRNMSLLNSCYDISIVYNFSHILFQYANYSQHILFPPEHKHRSYSMHSETSNNVFWHYLHNCRIILDMHYSKVYSALWHSSHSTPLQRGVSGAEWSAARAPTPLIEFVRARPVFCCCCPCHYITL